LFHSSHPQPTARTLQNGDREDVRAQVVRHVGVGMSAKQRLHALCAAPLSHQGEEKLLVRRAAMLKQTSKRSHVVVFSLCAASVFAYSLAIGAEGQGRRGERSEGRDRGWEEGRGEGERGLKCWESRRDAKGMGQKLGRGEGTR